MEKPQKRVLKQKQHREHCFVVHRFKLEGGEPVEAFRPGSHHFYGWARWQGSAPEGLLCVVERPHSLVGVLVGMNVGPALLLPVSVLD